LRAEYRSYTDHELLLAYVAVMAELRRREITRSSNCFVADHAEGLIAPQEAAIRQWSRTATSSRWARGTKSRRSALQSEGR
jgi:hypothetical protein